MRYPLQVKISWRTSYQSIDEPYYDSAYTDNQYDTDPASHDCFNFLKSGNTSNSFFYGYFPLNRQGSTPSLSIERIDQKSVSEETAKCPSVFWVAKREIDKELCLIGWYEDAEVFRNPQDFPKAYKDVRDTLGRQLHDLKYRIRARKAFLIPEERRPTIGKLSEFGLTDRQRNRHLYLDDTGEHAAARQKYRKRLELLQKYIQDANMPNLAGSTSIMEEKVRVLSNRLERRGQYHHIRGHLGDRCQACNFDPNSTDHPEIWGASLEIHHKDPYSALKEGEKRFLGVENYALLCARCHRAIHATKDIKYIGNIPAFRHDILKLND